MFCKQCGATIPDTASFCTSCGKVVERANVTATEVPRPAPAAPVQPAPVYREPPKVVNNTYNYTAPSGKAAVPPEYAPLSPWAYFGLSLLYVIPVVGFIFLIIHSANGGNLNRRNFARFHWIPIIISAIITVLYIIIGIIVILAVGGSMSSLFDPSGWQT